MLFATRKHYETVFHGAENNETRSLATA